MFTQKEMQLPGSPPQTDEGMCVLIKDPFSPPSPAPPNAQ